MTIGEQARIEGFAANIEFNGRTLRVDSGTTFQALVEDADQNDEEFLLGNDPREMVRVHALKSSITDALTSQQQLVLDDGQKIKVVRRADSPANQFVRFFAKKIVAGKDT